MGLAELEPKLLQLGGMVPIVGNIVPMHESELEELEGALKSRLPETYREFLARYGACAFGAYVQAACKRPLPPHLSGGRGLPLSYFYGGKTEDPDEYSVVAAIENYSERMPRSVIPIAEDGGGNQYCLGISGAERGHVYYWDHDNEWDEEDYVDKGLPVPERLQFQNLHYVADTFDEFVQILVADE